MSDAAALNLVLDQVSKDKNIDRQVLVKIFDLEI
jgi:hypothetical protein